jgi:hypothetical protein
VLLQIHINHQRIPLGWLKINGDSRMRAITQCHEGEKRPFIVNCGVCPFFRSKPALNFRASGIRISLPIQFYHPFIQPQGSSPSMMKAYHRNQWNEATPIRTPTRTSTPIGSLRPIIHQRWRDNQRTVLIQPHRLHLWTFFPSRVHCPGCRQSIPHPRMIKPR